MVFLEVCKTRFPNKAHGYERAGCRFSDVSY